mmetsp:Transcript_4195/g.12000  ORF Transcript_4195/g.12000 Transcript_4195/m.12000 type:complete len:221 (-) Transcript_4195:268-930(-)
MLDADDLVGLIDDLLCDKFVLPARLEAGSRLFRLENRDKKLAPWFPTCSLNLFHASLVPASPDSPSALTACRPLRNLANICSAVSVASSAESRKLTAVRYSTSAKCSNDLTNVASKDTHICSCALAISSSISAITPIKLAISSPTDRRRSASSYARRSAIASSSLSSSAGLMGRCSRHAIARRRVDSAMSAPHLPNVLVRAAISLRLSFITCRCCISWST